MVREVSSAQTHEDRAESARIGEALPDGSYQIRDCNELQAAVQKERTETANTTVVRRFIIRRSIELGCTEHIPDEWEVEISNGGQSGTDNGPYRPSGR
jgi:hypothetical protein